MSKQYQISGLTFLLRPEGGEKNRQVTLTGAEAQTLIGALPPNLVPQTPNDRLIRNPSNGEVGFLPASAIEDPRVASMIGADTNTNGNNTDTDTEGHSALD